MAVDKPMPSARARPVTNQEATSAAATTPAQGDTTPTRRLCAGVHADPRLRDVVLSAFLDEPHRPWPPTYGLDATALLRHAIQARRWQLGRDALATLLLVGVPAVMGGRLAARYGIGVVAGTALFAAVAVALSWALWKTDLGIPALRRRVGARFRRRPIMMSIEGFLVTFILVTLAGSLLRAPGVAVDVALLLGGLLAVYVIMAGSECLSLTRAIRAWKEEPRRLRERAPALRPALELRLRDTGDEAAGGADPWAGPAFGRVVYYDTSADRDDTHVGSGEVVGDWPIQVDVSLGRLDDDGHRMVPRPISISALHQWLETAAGQAGVAGLWHGHRVYVDGNRAPLVKPGMLAAPPSRLPMDRLVELLEDPRPYCRTYLCLQKAGDAWKGDLVVTLFVRAELVGTNLHLTNRISVLPKVALPPTKEAEDDEKRRLKREARKAILDPARNPSTKRKSKKHGMTLRQRRRKVPVTALRTTLPAVVRAPLELGREMVRPLRRMLRHQEARRRLANREPVNFGTDQSIRERLAVGQRLIDPDARDDVVRDLYYLENRLTEAFKQYLELHDIDVSKLDDTVRTMINNQFNTIENLVSKNVTFGTNSQAGDSTKPAAQNRTVPNQRAGA